MKNAIHEYISLTSTEKNELWENATFIFDTNVFLNLYRYSKKTRDIMFKAFVNFKDRIWMPNHVAHEIMKNRCEVIWETNERYETISKESEKFLQKCIQELRLSNTEDEYKELEKYINTWLKKNQKKNHMVKTFSEDAILDQLLFVFDGKVGTAFTQEELAEIEKDGKVRYDKKVPPGFKDIKKQNDAASNNSYGDLIVWKEILNYAKQNKKDIIYVTNDQKEDWWYILHNKTVGPRVELRKEFEDYTGQKFHMYTMSNFISIYDDENQVQVEKTTINEIQLFSRVIRRVGTRQELNDYYETLEDEHSKVIAKIKFKIMRLKVKNEKREKSIRAVKMNNPNWRANDELVELVNNNLAHIEKDSALIAVLEEKMSRLENMYEIV